MKTKSKVKSAAKKTAAKVLKAVKSSAAKLAGRDKVAGKKAAKPASRPAVKPADKKSAPKMNHSAKKHSNRAVEDPSQLSEAQVRKMPASEYMNDVQLEFFRRRLIQMREEVLARELDVKERLHQREVFADPADRASAEEEHWLDLRLRERESLLLRKIDEALRRIKDKEYGYCEVTGEPIGIPRLLARPTATVCVDVKGHNEQIESQFRDR
ncbi:MAG TPA: RNA polymerase-binding protein DksA [Nevskiaceae bacterium]|nr:RNA polymerase-binding protein DksA [Nevskiaceae bacterium]